MASIPKELNKTTKMIEESFQNIRKRPFDRIVLAPFMIWYALKSKSMPKTARALLLTSGVYNIFYNLEEYKKIDSAIQTGRGDIIAEAVLDIKAKG